MAEIDKPKELDRNTPVAIHLAVEIAKGLGAGVKDYPIVFGFIALTQVFIAGDEVSRTLQGNPPSLEEVKLSHTFMMMVGGLAGILLEGGVRLVRAWVGVEKRWKAGEISSAEIFGRDYPEE